MHDAYDRLRRLTIEGDVGAARELYSEAQRHDQPDDATLAAELLLVGGGWRLELGAHSAAAPQRVRNEDTVHARDRLLVVATGSGAHTDGAIASTLAVETVRELFEPGHRIDQTQLAGDGGLIAHAVRTHPAPRERPVEPLERLRSAVALADRRIEACNDRLGVQALSSSLDAVVVHGHRAAIAHVGLGRVLRLHGGVLTRQTTDHGMGFVLRQQGRDNEAREVERSGRFPDVVARALGSGSRAPESAQPELLELGFEPGDRLLVVVGALWQHTTAEMLRSLIDDGEDRPPALTCARLVALAHARGAHRHLSAALARLDEA